MAGVVSGEVMREDCVLSMAGGRESPLAGCFAANGAVLDEEASRSFGSSIGTGSSRLECALIGVECPKKWASSFQNGGSGATLYDRGGHPAV
jgi:hypothetical protein